MSETDINLWELDTEELNFVNERYSDNRYTQHKLAFAVMLKYFYINTLYPTNDDVVPINAEKMIARQLERRRFACTVTTDKHPHKPLRAVSTGFQSKDQDS